MTDRSSGTSAFVPLTLGQWRQLVTDAHLAGPLTAYGVTAGLLVWGEFGPDDTEDALFAAQTIAGVAALTLDEPDPGARRVVVAVPATGFVADPDSALGEGRVAHLDLGWVEAVFSDDPAVPVSRARSVAHGLTVAEAWDHADIADFSDVHDLGWHTIHEATTW